MPLAPAPSGTLRIVGVVLVAGGRAVDVALVESDGLQIARRLERRRLPLDDGVVGTILRFIGDLALQPHAIDLIAAADDGHLAAVGDLGDSYGIEVVCADPGRQWPHLALAERVALAAARDAVAVTDAAAPTAVPAHW